MENKGRGFRRLRGVILRPSGSRSPSPVIHGHGLIGRPRGEGDRRRVGGARGVGPRDRNPVLRTVARQRVGQRVRTVDRRAADRGDLVARPQARPPRRGSRRTTPETVVPAVAVGLSCTPRKPGTPWWIVSLFARRSTIRSAIAVAVVDRDREARRARRRRRTWPRPVEAAVSMPITAPSRRSSGPPESPACTAASTWISPVSRSASVPFSSEAVMSRANATTWPDAAVGVPPLPPALPTAVTASPTATSRGVGESGPSGGPRRRTTGARRRRRPGRCPPPPRRRTARSRRPSP